MPTVWQLVVYAVISLLRFPEFAPASISAHGHRREGKHPKWKMAVSRGNHLPRFQILLAPTVAPGLDPLLFEFL